MLLLLVALLNAVPSDQATTDRMLVSRWAGVVIYPTHTLLDI